MPERRLRRGFRQPAGGTSASSVDPLQPKRMQACWSSVPAAKHSAVHPRARRTLIPAALFRAIIGLANAYQVGETRMHMDETSLIPRRTHRDHDLVD
jgi:hypothetical protein